MTAAPALRAVRSILAALTLGGALAHAQRPATTEPPRPRLPEGTDTAEASSYLDLARASLCCDGAMAAAAAYWATRLDPLSAEALVVRWRAESRRLPRRDRKRARERVDSLLLRAMLRDPFVDLAEMPVPTDQRLRETRRLLAKDSTDDVLWFAHAAIFYRARMYDSAVANLDRALAAIERAERDSVREVYRSRALYHYALGRAFGITGDMRGARRAFEAALVEELGFSPAHAALGTIAWYNDSDIDAASREFDLAVQLQPEDGFLRFEYGTALVKAGRHAEALAQLDAALALEPHYATAHYNRAVVLDQMGRDSAAAAAYAEFLRRTPRQFFVQQRVARSRLAALRGEKPDSTK